LRKEDILEESIIQKLVDEVYSEGYVDKDEEEFDRVRRIFPEFSKGIVPFIHKRQSEDTFYSLFKAIEVVPYQFKLEYLEELEHKRYFEAVKYVTSISIGQFNKLKANNALETEKDMHFVYVDYDNELGLLLEEEPTSLGTFD
jgi:CRISPR-associated endonuclease/helicase Cas3